MAEDTRTPVLGLLKQGTGNNNNTWGDNLNTQVIDLIEKAIAGYAVVTVTGSGDVTLTDDEALCSVIELTGTLSADQNIIVPDVTKGWRFLNNTTGDFFVLVKVSGGTAVNAPQGCVTEIFCDGDGTVIRTDARNVGNMFYHAGTAAPPGSFECTGAAKKRASAVDLYAKIGTTWGSTDSTDFLLPDGYDTGRFLRSRTESLTVGTSQSSQMVEHSHTVSGTTGTESQSHAHTFSGTTGSQNANHAHPYASFSVAGGGGAAVGGGAGFYAISDFPQGLTSNENSNHQHGYSGTTSSSSVTHTHSFSATTSNAGSGTETRPESLVGMLCISY